MTDRGGRRVVMLVRNAFTHDSRVEKEARTLVQAGHEVTIVADHAPGLPVREQRDGSLVLRVARRGPRLPGLRFVLHELRLYRTLVRLRPQILHAHDSNALLPIALAARRLRIGFVYDAHDLWLGRPRRERSRLGFALHRAWYAVVERLLIPRASVVITVSPPIARHLEERHRLRRVRLVANYPDDREVGEASPTELRALTGGAAIDPDRPVALYLGGLMGGRGLEQLVDAMALTGAAQLVLLGDGLLAAPLRERAAAAGIGDRVHLVAPVPPDEVVAVAAGADLGVSPIVPSCLNYRYSLPNKLFQYMAAGLPVVASDFPQVREIVDGERCGLVADTTAPASIAAAIETILADRAEALAMGERGRAAIRRRLNWSTAAAELLEAYATL
jgi:glycosyltransferase involved in cell wall biosynthesis